MKNKICLVTGATSGIGFEIAAGLLKLGATVVITARDEARGQAALTALKPSGRAELLLLDLASLASVRKAAAEFLKRFPRLDVLVNNAGANLLTDALKKSAPSRIVTVASSALAPPDLDDLMSERSFDPMTVYARTKAANVLFTAELAERLAGTGATANCVHPGVVKTGLVRDARGMMKVMFALFRPFFATPRKGAQNTIYAATSPAVSALTGQYFVGNLPAPNAYLNDVALRRGLWLASEQLVK